MPVFRWGHAFEAFAGLEREFDRLLQTAAHAARVGRQFPPINLYDCPTKFLLLAQLPGVEAGELDLSVADRRLTLCGRRLRPEGVSETQFRRRERLIGDWERTIMLPDRVDENAISADFQSGLLTLTLPKIPTGAVRQIVVEDRIGDGGEGVFEVPQNASRTAEPVADGGETDA